MNIFATDPNPVLSAVALDDKRIVKMALESAQMLSSAIRLTVPTPDEHLYRNTHQHHPCSVWSRKNLHNFLWLYDHGKALCAEYTHRYERRHKSEDIIDLAYNHLEVFGDPFPELSSETVFDFNSSGWIVGDVFHSYRLCMMQKWLDKDSRPPRWTHRDKPEWYLPIRLEYEEL